MDGGFVADAVSVAATLLAGIFAAAAAEDTGMWELRATSVSLLVLFLAFAIRFGL